MGNKPVKVLSAVQPAPKEQQVPGMRQMQAFFMAVLLCCALFITMALAACSDSKEQTEEAESTAETETTEEEEASFSAHGSTYSKTETVSATMGFDGEVDEISVSEWIKNPDELETISDVSTLQAITAEEEEVTYTASGETIEWQANGSDINYTGITSQALPFEITYTFKLDGEEVSAEELEGATGQLELTIEYTNTTEETITVNGSTQTVQQPYVMASIVSFDSEHAKNVSVDNGSVIDQDGSFIAVGLGMPGLAETLGLEDQIDLPQSVTISADIIGFEVPSITTMVTNQVLSSIDETTIDDANSSIDDVFSQVDTIEEAITTLGEGVSGIDTALATINEGQTALNEAFPNATSGLTQLSALSEGISTGTEAVDTLVDTSSSSISGALEELESIDTSTLSEDDAAAVESAIASLQAANQANAGATAGLEQVDTAASTLTSGLTNVAEGLTQIQTGYEQLAEATAQVNTATSTLSSALDTMGDSIESALSEVRGTIDEELELIEALSEMAEESGAFCGNADDMPASTTFMITASVD